MYNEAINYLKGIGIILMVMAHSHAPQICRDVISLFHMPLFFWASGYCFKEEYVNRFGSFAKKRIVGIYWPYVKWTLFFILLHNTLFSCNILDSFYSLGEIKTRCLEALKMLVFDEQLLGGYWFLKSLFWGSFIFYASIWIVQKMKFTENYRLLAHFTTGAILLTLSALLSFKYKEFTILRISSWDFHAAFFIWCGYACRLGEPNLKKRTSLFIIAAILLLALGINFWRGSMTDISFSRFFPFTITALLCTITTFSLCTTLHNKMNMNFYLLKIGKILGFTGRNTLTILTWHFLSFKVVSYALIRINDLPITSLAEYPVLRQFDDTCYMWVFYLSAGIVIPLLLSRLNMYIPNKYLRL